MKVALICQYYPPNKTSAAVQMRDLALGFKKLGHKVYIAVPSGQLTSEIITNNSEGIKVFRFPSPKITNVNFIKRAIGELLMPFFMLRGIRASDFPTTSLELVVWYSPSIFFGPVVSFLKMKSSCKGYLILRDMFPEWLADVGVMKKRFAYYFFKMVASYQYRLANVIGVQSKSNLSYFDGWEEKHHCRVEVLENWLDSENEQSEIPDYLIKDLSEKKIIVYAGNMGVAQKMDILIELANSLQYRNDIHFLFVGRGTEKKRLETMAANMELNNITFHDEIDPSSIKDLLQKCSLGLIALDPRHKSHNIPGKFLSYLAAGLPILARINRGSDLEHIINSEELGLVYTGDSVKEFSEKTIKLINDNNTLGKMRISGKAFFLKTYSVRRTIDQIIRNL